MLVVIVRLVLILIFMLIGSQYYLNVIYPKIRYKETLESVKDYGVEGNAYEPVYGLEKKESLFKRFGGGIFDKVVEKVYMLVPLGDEYQQDLHGRLRSAGIEEDPRYFLASSMVSTFIFMLSGWALAHLMSLPLLAKVQYVIVGMLIGILKARMRIQKGMKERKWLIRRQLPDVLDVISASVAAGLAFDQSLIYVVERGRGPLVHEFDIVMREMSLGRPRKEALNAMADRCEVDEVTTLVGAINQATSYGIPMQNVLLTQAQIIRENRKMEAEETAAKMPVKMLFPMVFFIFPVIFVIILYPIVPDILEALAGAL